jgi:hypothetical protein
VSTRAVLLLLLAGCQVPDTDGATEGAMVSGSRWRLAWDRDGTVPSSEGGWSVESDRGYRVHLQAGEVIVHSVALGRCGAVAGAGHADVDASHIDLGIDEDLDAPWDQGPFQVNFDAARYCRVHWLVARAHGDTAAPFQQVSLRLRGRWSRAGEARDFTVATWWPEGQLVELAPSAAVARATITVERKLARLFGGIDFASAADAVIAGRALQNLVGTAVVRVSYDVP